MRIDFSSLDEPVTENFLDHAQIRPAFEHVRSARVPEQVRVDGNSRSFRLALEDTPDTHPT